ncbi:GGDEF domain-containing protein [Roseiarcus fermentans]|uniref:GGDEF domain-containing protein n=1 Tax=Roseiarcus fermentans TaxID=1473586 RepID=UPI0014758778|nr:GGDEF domain-containing protein [Roseiarcus fermentans]
MSRDLHAETPLETLGRVRAFAAKARAPETTATDAQLADILDPLARLLESQLPGASSSVLLLDPVGDPLGDDGPLPSSPHAPAAAAVGSGPGAGARAAARAPDVGRDPAVDHGFRSRWSAPILSRDGRVLGTFAVDCAAAREPTGAEAALIAAVAGIAGIAVERRLAERRIHHLATHDALTGLANRASLGDRLTRALLAAERCDRRAAVAFIDIDDFKSVNDSLGHSAGDEVLRTIAARLAGSVRTADTVARFGGDEFVVVLGDRPGSADDIGEAVDRLRAAIAAEVRIGRRIVRVTASVGLAIFPDHGRDAAALLANADAAMYRAKKGGRGVLRRASPGIDQNPSPPSTVSDCPRT